MAAGRTAQRKEASAPARGVAAREAAPPSAAPAAAFATSGPQGGATPRCQA